MAIWTLNTRQQKSSKSKIIIEDLTGSGVKITGDSKQRDSLGRTVKDKIGNQNLSTAPDCVEKNSRSNLKELKNGFSSHDYSFQRESFESRELSL